MRYNKKGAGDFLPSSVPILYRAALSIEGESDV